MIDMLKKSLRITTTFEACFNLGIAHSNLAEWTEAIRAYEEALGLRTGDEETHGCLGRVHLEQNDPAAAEKHLLVLTEHNSPLAARLSQEIESWHQRNGTKTDKEVGTDRS